MLRNFDRDVAAAVHGLGGIQQQVQNRRANHLAVRGQLEVGTLDRDFDQFAGRVAAEQGDRLEKERANMERVRTRRTGTREEHQIVDELAERVDAGHHVPHDRQLGISRGPP